MHKHCKDCKHCTHGVGSASAVCHVPDEYTGLPKQVPCSIERESAAINGHCGSAARFYEERT